MFDLWEILTQGVFTMSNRDELIANDDFVISEVVTKASASLDAEVIQDLQTKDPEEGDKDEDRDKE